MQDGFANPLDAFTSLRHYRAMEPGGIESVGEAVSGGLLARAVEPQAGEAGEAPEAGRVCLNCGTALAGPYCHRCGQAAHIHRSVTAWSHDLAHGVLHLDGKIWRTLPLLAWRPGELTRRYVEGERARFVSPLALFLFSVFLMFALLSAIGGPAIGVDPNARRELAAELQGADRDIARLEAERRQRAARNQDVARVDARLGEAKNERRALATASETLRSGSPFIDTDVDTGWPRLDQGIRKANENPALLFYKLQTNAYKFSWALIPISVPFLWLLLLHRRRHRQTYKAYDHLVFVTYSIAFMSLAMIALVLLRSIGVSGGLIALAVMIVPPLHIYRQLRGAYQLGRFSAVWRTAALLVFAGIAVTLFLLLLLAMGVLA
jgi:uncharacterized protein DUF3667